ncbi:hypothetical protein KC460_05285, partial [Candidatus Dependentiae bacterium]|nr:hypothetical protein [Candidatus Dependentiae bacterium]
IIDECCSSLKTSTGELRSCCDFITSLIDPLIILIQSDTGALASIIDRLKTSTGELQSQIDQLSDCGDSCQSQIDELKTSTGWLQSQIDLVDNGIVSRVEIIEYKVEVLEECCDELKTSTGELQSQIDSIEPDAPCTILVTNTLAFTLDMLPGINEAVVFKFDPCFAPCK